MISQITPDGLRPAETGNVDCRLGMTSANENAAGTGNEWEYVTWRADGVGSRFRIDSDGDGSRAVGCRNARCDALARLDRHGECGFQPGLVSPRHWLETEQIRAFLGQCEADQAAAVARHEVDRIRCGHLRGNDEVAFILPVVVVVDGMNIRPFRASSMIRSGPTRTSAVPR